MLRRYTWEKAKKKLQHYRRGRRVPQVQGTDAHHRLHPKRALPPRQSEATAGNQGHHEGSRHPGFSGPSTYSLADR